MLLPSSTKYRKYRKGRIKGEAKSGTDLAFGSFGLKSLDPARITSRQIEAARRAITRHLKRTGKLWIRIFPDRPVTAKPAEVRRGSGKGDVSYWAAVVHPGRIIFELDFVDEELAKSAFERAAAKLPIKLRFVKLLRS